MTTSRVQFKEDASGSFGSNKKHFFKKGVQYTLDVDMQDRMERWMGRKIWEVIDDKKPKKVTPKKNVAKPAKVVSNSDNKAKVSNRAVRKGG